jgi:hypothetical protein
MVAEVSLRVWACVVCLVLCPGASPRSVSSLVKCAASGFAMRPYLALRGGGGGPAKRPGTVDYSLWDDLSASSEDDSEAASPRVIQLAKPSDVTIDGPNIEIQGKVKHEMDSGGTWRTVDDEDPRCRQMPKETSLAEKLWIHGQPAAGPQDEADDSVDEADFPATLDEALRRTPRFVREEDVAPPEVEPDKATLEEWDPAAGGWRGVNYARFDALDDPSEEDGGAAGRSAVSYDETEEGDRLVRGDVRAEVAAAKVRPLLRPRPLLASLRLFSSAPLLSPLSSLLSPPSSLFPLPSFLLLPFSPPSSPLPLPFLSSSLFPPPLRLASILSASPPFLSSSLLPSSSNLSLALQQHPARQASALTPRAARRLDRRPGTSCA